MRQQIGDAPNIEDIQPKQRRMAAAQKQDEDDDAGWDNVDTLLN